MPARLLDEPVDLREPEGALDDIGPHAVSGVGHRQHDILAGTNLGLGSGIGVIEVRVGRLDGQAAAARHRVARINAQVQQRVADLRGVGERAGRSGLGRPASIEVSRLQSNLISRRATERITASGSDAKALPLAERHVLSVVDRVGSAQRVAQHVGADLKPDS